MHLFTIGDLHLSFGVPDKPMDIFGGWKNYQFLLEQNWRAKVDPMDTVVLAGDLSWGMTLEEAKEDFAFIDALPGRKIILKGNHDYWWTSRKKMEEFFAANHFRTLHILHNNHYNFEGYGICGTRGWVSMQGEAADAKILAREAQRLEVSIQSAVNAGCKPVVFLHYPPIYGSQETVELIEILKQYDIRKCYYGHIHGKGHEKAYIGRYGRMELRLISSDYLQFNPEIVL